MGPAWYFVDLSAFWQGYERHFRILNSLAESATSNLSDQRLVINVTPCPSSSRTILDRSRCRRNETSTQYKPSAKLTRRKKSRKVSSWSWEAELQLVTVLIQITGKAEAVSRRNEKLAKRNPERLQKQIEELKQITSGGGKLTKHEETLLESLERDLKQVKKAREALGDEAPTFSRGGPRPGGPGVLGKRRRDDEDASSTDGDVPDDVKQIPMPRDTPPPISKEVMDKWYAKRRAKRTNANEMPLGTNANNTPLGGNKERRPWEAAPSQPAPPPAEARTVYEAQPVIRDLRKEAVRAFMPTAVRMKLEKGKGQGELMEPEEADQLEREGYLKTTDGGGNTVGIPTRPQTVTMEDAEEEDDS